MAIALISLSAVHLAYGHHPLLDGADLTIQSDERIGLIGRNGAGKSSLLRLLDGRTEPDDGAITVAGHVRVATVEQEPVLDESLTIEQTVMGEYDPDNEDWQRGPRVLALIDKLGLPPAALVGTLSGGMRKRVALISAMANQPTLLLLDEPTNHLDLEIFGVCGGCISARTRCVNGNLRSSIAYLSRCIIKCQLIGGTA